MHTRHFVPALLLLVLLCTAESSGSEITNGTKALPSEKPPRWTALNMRVDLTTVVPEIEETLPNIEFAKDGSEYILVWWLLPRSLGDWRKAPIGRVVLKSSGKTVAEAVDSQMKLTSAFAERFPHAASRDKFAQFIQSADAWGFSSDQALGLRLYKRKESIRYMWSGELYDLATETELWKIDLPRLIASVINVTFYSRDGDDLILVAFSGRKAFILSQQEGTVRESFEYGPPNTEQTRQSYRRKAGIMGRVDDRTLDFSASRVSVHALRGLMACGDLETKRIRLVSLDRPHAVVAELNVTHNPTRPDGGCWRAERIEFCGGKYLLASYVFGGPATPLQFEPTEIYDIDTWRLVWEENQTDVKSVALSPDGTRIALVRGRILEVRE